MGKGWHILRRVAALLTFLLTLYLGQRAFTEPSGVPSPSPTVNLWPAMKAYEGPFWSAYFTLPERPESQEGYGGPDQILAQVIGLARQEVLAAVYALDSYRILDALRDAARSGATVRVVLGQVEPQTIAALEEAGIPVVVAPQDGGYMHHKFLVVDQSEVWTGSMNFTFAGAYRHNNHLVRLFSSRLAANYTREFDEMFRLRVFGRGSSFPTPYPQVEVQGILVETYFLPEEAALPRLVALTREAREEVLFLAFSFTSDDLAEAMLERHHAGVRIRGVMEAEQVGQGSEYHRLREAGVDVRLDGNPEAMHHKVLVWDRRIVAFGSYNFSQRAETVNDENLLIIHDPALAAAFVQEFERLYAQARK